MRLCLTLLPIFIATIWLADIADAQNPCSAAKMQSNYREMRRANCKNCDKYFHCQGNFEAVHRCRGPLKVTTAAAISNAREWSQGGSSGSGRKDSEEDQKANRYGRSGGNCAARYLRPLKCRYNPSTRRCG